MGKRDDDDSSTLESPIGELLSGVDPTRELTELMAELVSMLKNPDVVAALTKRGVNASLALLAVDGVGAYLVGDKQQAAEDLKTVGEEIEARLSFGNDPPHA
jgi:hypothetical protein